MKYTDRYITARATQKIITVVVTVETLAHLQNLDATHESCVRLLDHPRMRIM